MAATADQFEQIERVVKELDQPSQRQRITDFVPLQFAEAEKIQEALEVFYGPYAYEADTPGKRNVSRPLSITIVMIRYVCMPGVRRPKKRSQLNTCIAVNWSKFM